MSDLISRSALGEALELTCFKMSIVPMRLISKVINEQPAVDAMEVVRCRDCKHRVEPTKLCAHPKAVGWDALEPEDDDFCSCGERKDND